MTEASTHRQWGWEWVGGGDKLPPFKVVCSGGRRHKERELAVFPVSRRFGLIAGSAPQGQILGGKTLGAPEPGRRPLHFRKPSYQVVLGQAGEITGRHFHCRACDTPYSMTEAEFVQSIELLLRNAGGKLSARRFDLSVPGATLL